MFLRRSLAQPAIRAGLFSNIFRASVSSSNQPLDAVLCSSNPQMLHSLSGKSHVCDGVRHSLLERFGLEGVSLPCAMSTRRLIHSGEPKESEGARNYEGARNPSNMNTGRGIGIWDRNGRNFMDSFQRPQYNVEQNADIVHIKMLRNNTFVTVTDSKGNKKFGLSAGKLSDKGGKVSRYAAEASAEEVGRIIRDRGIKSIVVKVNGYTYFKKKKQAILSLKEGYSHHRGDKHPIVYIEDTTRRAHNGCRLRKKRRV